MKKYSNDEIHQKLKTYPNWTLAEDALERTFILTDFSAALALIVRIGLLAEQADHHPDLHNVYNKVRVRLNTHDVGGITDKDFHLAKQINDLV